MSPEELNALLESVGAATVTEVQFNDCAEKAKGVTTLTNDQKLVTYGLFKQATVGAINTKRPWGVDLVGCAKWDSWKSYEAYPKEKAMLAYVCVLAKLTDEPLPTA